MNDKITKIAAIDALLPQTQCQLCEFSDCYHYAQAIVTDGAAIDRCHPGGEVTLEALAAEMELSPESYRETVKAQFKAASVVVIQEEACIGCTKCIQACPVDAIVGSGKLMHTVLTDHCTGCDLCIPPCPVDCIERVPVQASRTAEKAALFVNRSRDRYQKRQARLARDHRKKHAKSSRLQITQQSRQAAIVAAMARVKEKQDRR